MFESLVCRWESRLLALKRSLSLSYWCVHDLRHSWSSTASFEGGLAEGLPEGTSSARSLRGLCFEGPSGARSAKCRLPGPLPEMQNLYTSSTKNSSLKPVLKWACLTGCVGTSALPNYMAWQVPAHRIGVAASLIPSDRGRGWGTPKQ